MLLYRKGKSLFFLFWAVSVFLLCTGSLINFHQNKIWGKPLNTQIVAVKRDSSKILKINSGDSGSTCFAGAGIPDSFRPVYLTGIRIVVCSGPAGTYTSGTALAAGLRAPPAFV